eukprot:2345191-Prymnesium_polylepis.1
MHGHPMVAGTAMAAGLHRRPLAQHRGVGWLDSQSRILTPPSRAAPCTTTQASPCTLLLLPPRPAPTLPRVLGSDA